MKLVLDAGALIAVDRRVRAVAAQLRVAQQERIPVHTSGGVVAQIWRNGAHQADLARVLAGVKTLAIDSASARQIGTLLATSRSDDLVDAHVALLAVDGDRVLTSDPTDIRRLLRARSVSATIVRT